MNKPKIGVLMYTYNRTDDAKINMEIIRNLWSKSEILKDAVIVHSFNGEKEWWPEKYLEDELLSLENSGHFNGAVNLINKGVKTFQEKYNDVDYVIVLASDTWLVKPDFLERTIVSIQNEEKYLGVSVWGDNDKDNIWEKGCSLDLCIFNLKWATESKLFPLRFDEFKDKYEDLFFYQNKTVYPEIVFMVRFKQAISRSVKIPSDNILKKISDSYIYRIVEREPIHKSFYSMDRPFHIKKNSPRTMYWPKIGLITHHEPSPKQKALASWKLNTGDFTKIFLNSKDLSYYNRGLEKNAFEKNGKKINYGD